MDKFFGSLFKPGDSLPWFSWLLEYFWWLLGGLLGPLGSPSASWTASGTLLPLLGPPVPLELSWQVLGGSALGHFARFWAALGRFRITLPESHGTPITLLETHCTPDHSSRATWHPDITLLEAYCNPDHSPRAMNGIPGSLCRRHIAPWITQQPEYQFQE